MKTTADIPSKLTAVDFDPFAGGELFACVPPTEAQKEIWIAVQMGNEANCAYNESMCLRLQGNLDLESLRFSIQELVQRHDALRATFSPDGSTLCVAASIALDIPTIDLSILDDRDRESKLAYLRRQEVDRPFNLVSGPLFRSQIIKLQEQEHIVIITGHHIICDGWSWGILFPDLGAIYSAKKQGLAANLPQPESFTEYAILQEAQSTSTEVIDAEDYWLKLFSDTTPVVDLPTDRPRPALRTYNGSREDWELNPDLVANLKRLGKKAGCSFFTTLFAGFEAFMYRLCGQEDLVVGMLAAGQLVGGKDKLAGHCVSLLPLRTRIDGEQSFIDYLRSRRTGVLDALDRQQITFGTLMKKLALPRDFSRIPLVPVTFNLDVQLTEEQLNFPGFKAEAFSNPRTYENFEWAVNASETKSKLVLECQYNTNIFDAATICRRMAEFEVLLEAIAANPKQKISELPLLTEIERHQLHVEWNNTWAEYPQDKCIHQLFEAQVERSPDAIAVVFEEEKLTYRELNARANQLAHYLRSLGVGPEVLVGICVERSLLMAIGLLGVLKAGGAYVPIDPAYPRERITYVLQDAGALVLLTQKSLLENWPESGARLVCVDANWNEIAQQSQDNPNSLVKPDNLAYVIYTSGSTGKPKGVQIPHSAVGNFLTSMSGTPGLEASDILLAVTTVSFDIAALEIFLPLTLGASSVLVSREVASDGRQLSAILARTGATVMQATPATWRMLLESGWIGSSNLKILCGGEALPRELANQLLSRCASLWNMYGPTETTIWSAVSQVTAGDEPVRIGRAIANTQFYICDSHLQPVPVGVRGELLIGGVGLARGYLNRLSLTEDKFIPNPFSDKPDARLYKTGDLARYLTDGNIEYFGRMDNQVKIRGFRIELGEIETLLSQHPDVRETAVIARENVALDKQLVAYVVCHQQPAPAISDLRRFLKKKLPEYMVPGAFVVLEALPLTPNGKVDRRALATQKWQSASVAPDETISVTPRDKLELQVTKIWEQVLGINSVGIRDNFFEVGGHSLLAARLLAEIEKVFGKNLPLSAMFQSPTVEQLANILREPNWSSPSPSMVVIQPGTGSYKPPLFCIHALGRGLEFYRPLLNHLDRSQAVLGLSTQIMDEKLAPPNRVEELAAYYIKEMQVFQPYGPYFLLGVSFGGTVAFEMARQLNAKGEKVALLGFLDTYGPDAFKHLPEIKSGQRVMKMLRLKPGVFLNKAKSNLMGKIEMLTFIQYRILCKFYRLIGRPLPIYLENFTHEELNNEALRHYVAGVYSGRATIFKAVESASVFGADRELGWGEVVAGGIEINEIPSDHLGMLQEPHVRILGEKLQAAVDRAQG
ncbi:amino acid adenylation domain-containing protein [Lyngbya sp. CCAP 1446/10]|uniref:non-ribosomal peptide synthetase n=1 Tax=Lyngbya sp. CCAP 1446/10 TaxID=439293 RepID=UPI0022378C04|nr:non-ribosomal peptide synthetase [Lyngbya sp. CCAP 1446/10]MCW6050713.1 amino acid adenylation domain-containing protein [Lyngbya sp. CCAP 1446/10]